MPQTAWLESVRLWQHSFMDRRAIDLFDDAPWPTEVPVNEPASPRPWLVASLVLAGLFLMSMALPWFTSPETPAWTPFSHWLDLGWSPGTPELGFPRLGPRSGYGYRYLHGAPDATEGPDSPGPFGRNEPCSCSVSRGPSKSVSQSWTEPPCRLRRVDWHRSGRPCLDLYRCLHLSRAQDPGAGTVGHVGASYRP